MVEGPQGQLISRKYRLLAITGSLRGRSVVYERVS